MKTNEEYIKSITPDDYYIRGCTDFWVYPNNNKSYGRKFVLERQKNYIIPASYIKYADIGVVSGGQPSLTEPREDTISAMRGSTALEEYSTKGNYLRVQYLGGDRFLEPKTGETLFLDHTSFVDPQPTHGVYRSVIESNWLSGNEFKDFMESNPLFIQGAGPIHCDFEIYDFESTIDMQKAAEKGFHVLTHDEIISSFTNAKEKNKTHLSNRYQDVLKRNQEDAVVLEKIKSEFLSMQQENNDVKPKSR